MPVLIIVKEAKEKEVILEPHYEINPIFFGLIWVYATYWCCGRPMLRTRSVGADGRTMSTGVALCSCCGNIIDKEDLSGCVIPW